MKFSRRDKVITGVIIVLILGIIGVKSLHYRTHYLPNTKINQTNISNMTVKQAKNELTKSNDGSKYIMLDNNKKIGEFSNKDIGISYTNKLLTNTLNGQSSFGWLWSHFETNRPSINSKNLKIDTPTFDTFVKSRVDQLNQGRTQTKNAEIVKEDNSFKIEPEVQGDKLDLDKVKKNILSTIDNNKTDIQLDKSYVKPSVKKNSNKLKNELKTIQRISNIKIKFDVDGNVDEVPSNTVKKFVSFDNQQIVVNKLELENYINSEKKKYDTYDKPLNFKTTNKGQITVPAGIYGWHISLKKAVDSMSKQILKGKDFTEKGELVGSGIQFKDRQVGNTYIEVDKDAQHMWFYKDGQQLISTDVVTARPPKETPSGVWSVWSKQRNSVLKGTNFDGKTQYNTPVKYWMPIDETGVGIHDAPWQPKFGGDWYVEHGSHGCINTPPATVAKLFEETPLGTPVIVY